MQFWMSFHLLNAVLWMALSTHTAEGNNYTEECPSHSISGIALPVNDIKHNISVWQKEDFQINFAGLRKQAFGKKWTNITTIPSDGKICIVSPKLLSEPGYCRAPDEFVDIAVHTENSLWRLDCNGDSCRCQHHRLIGVRIGRDLMSKMFWWPAQNISKIVIALYLYSIVENVTTFEVPSPLKWHDIFIGGRSTGYPYQLMSSSLNMNDSRNGQNVWIYGVNDEGEKIPSYFALDCDDEPTEYPGEGMVDDIKRQSLIRGWWYPALSVLLLVLILAVVTIIRCSSRRRRQETDLAPQSQSHNMVPLEHPPKGLGDRTSEDDHEYSYIDTAALRIQLEREGAEGLKPPEPVRDSVDRKSADNHEYCYIDAEALRRQLEKDRTEEVRPQDLVDRRSADNHEYCYIDTKALRAQLEKEKMERLDGQSRRKMSTTSHDSKNSLYEELNAGEG